MIGEYLLCVVYTLSVTYVTITSQQQCKEKITKSTYRRAKGFRELMHHPKIQGVAPSEFLP